MRMEEPAVNRGTTKNQPWIAYVKVREKHRSSSSPIISMQANLFLIRRTVLPPTPCPCLSPLSTNTDEASTEWRAEEEYGSC